MKPPTPRTPAGLAEWEKLSEEQQLAATRHYLHMEILSLADRLRRVSFSEDAAEAHYLIKFGVSRLMRAKGPKDMQLRGAVQVLTGSQPGKSGVASKYRVIGDRVKRWVGHQFPPEGAPCDPPDADRWAEAANHLACDLEHIDPKFRDIETGAVASVLAAYRATKSKQGLTDAVTSLCVASGALGTSPLVNAEGPERTAALRKLRGRVDVALKRKKK